MVISRKDIYNYFVKNAGEIIVNLTKAKVDMKDDIKTNNNLLKINLNILSNYKLEFYAIYGIELKDIDISHNKIVIQNTITLKTNRTNIIRKVNKLNTEGGQFILDLIKNITSQYFDTKRTVNRLKKKLQSINNKLIFYNKYIDIDRMVIFHIISKINRYYEDRLLEGKRVYLGHGLGYLIIEYPNKRINKPRIDWNESNKLKKEILKRGEIPYSKHDHKSAIELGVEYNGIEWYVYHDVDIPYLNWRGVSRKLPNIDVFSFRPATYHKDTLNVDQIISKVKESSNIHDFNIGIINKMNVLLKANELQFLNYRNNDI